MRLAVTLIALVGFSALTAAAADDPREVESAEAAEVALLKISGMSGEECSGRVRKAAERIGGVLQIDVDYRKGRAEVIYVPTEVSAQSIVKAIGSRTRFKVRLITDRSRPGEDNRH
jgi:copper chaperone CopZ